MTSAEQARVAKLSFRLLKYCKTFDSPWYINKQDREKDADSSIFHVIDWLIEQGWLVLLS